MTEMTAAPAHPLNVSTPDQGMEMLSRSKEDDRIVDHSDCHETIVK